MQYISALHTFGRDEERSSETQKDRKPKTRINWRGKKEEPKYNAIVRGYGTVVVEGQQKRTKKSVAKFQKAGLERHNAKPHFACVCLRISRHPVVLPKSLL